MKQTLRRNKNKSYPKKPKSLEDVREMFLDPEIIQQYGYNLEKDFRFYIDTVIENDYAFTIYASHFAINFLEKNIGSRHYLMDGTFDSLPSEYYQLLIIAIEFRNDVSSFHSFKIILKCDRPPAQLLTALPQDRVIALLYKTINIHDTQFDFRYFPLYTAL